MLTVAPETTAPLGSFMTPAIPVEATCPAANAATKSSSVASVKKRNDEQMLNCMSELLQVSLGCPAKRRRDLPNEGVDDLRALFPKNTPSAKERIRGGRIIHATAQSMQEKMFCLQRLARAVPNDFTEFGIRRERFDENS